MIKEGRQDKLIAYSELGKVIIPTNDVRCGYAKILEVVKTSEKYTLVKAENVTVDYFDGISYQEFNEVLKINGYKIGFDRPFVAGNEPATEHQILAYNLDNGAVIVADTIHGGKSFNSIDVYCPNVNSLREDMSIFTVQSAYMSILNLCLKRGMMYPLKWIDSIIDNKHWHSREDISLWTYADTLENTSNGMGSSLWENTIDRILLADSEIEKILGNSKTLKPVFERR